MGPSTGGLLLAVLLWRSRALEGLEDQGENYTCILPIGSNEQLGESLLWKNLIGGVEREMHGQMRRADRTINQEVGEEKAGKEGREFYEPELEREETPQQRSSPVESEVGLLLRLADANTAAACSGTGTIAASALAFADGALDKEVDSKQMAPVREGVAKVLDSAPARSVLRKARRLKGNESCGAKPGFYCLIGLLKEQRNSLTPYEICVLTRTVSPCPAGFFCEGGESQPRACNKGMQCPVGSAMWKECGNGYYCPAPVLRFKCNPGYSCDRMAVKQDICPPGNYCPDGMNIICPEGHFCPPGQVRPTRCPWFASCPLPSYTPNFETPARWLLSILGLLWVLAIRAIPSWLHRRGGCLAALPCAAVVSLLAAGWVAKLELITPAAARLFAADLRDAGLFGGTPHGGALVLVSLVYLFLLHGLFLSPCVKQAKLRFALDLVVCAALCLAFNAYLRDWAAMVFLANLWLALKLIWMLLMQEGPLPLRLAALAFGFAAIVAGLLQLQCAALIQLLLLAQAAAVGRELFASVLPRLRMAAAMWQVQSSDLLSDSSFRPLMHSLVAESPRENPEAQPATAARVAASARACLDSEARISVRDMPPEVFAAWRSHYCGKEAEEGVIDIGDGDVVAGVSFELRDVSYCLGSHRKLLHNLSFSVPGGSNVAIMGASGSGKTTMLSVLSGRCGDGCFTGQLALDGMPLLPGQMAQLRPMIGYVPQDDIMHMRLTVRENIMFQAGLRLVEEEKDELVAETITALGLGHVADRAIADGLSGGQRKRVSVGMEVVTKPRILLLDEPSSGLDSSTAHRTLQMVLKGESTDACTTFASIHQPRWSTLNLFDMLVLLVPGGHLAFAGPVAAVKAYFQMVLNVDFAANENPADVIVDVSVFESARKLATSGLWKSPPQCLRALLFPTPQVANEEGQLQWQQEEYGRLLASLWKNFSSSTREALLPNEEPKTPGRTPSGMQALEVEVRRKEQGGLAREAHARAQAIRWEQQVWLHVARTLLTTCRALPSVLAVQLTVMFSTAVLTTAFGKLISFHVFLPLALQYLLLSILQSVAAQRLFGGDEQQLACREGAVCSLWQVLFTFLGKDLASLPEIAFAAFCFAMTHWPLSGSLLSCSDQLALAFALIYSIWGLNHIWAITCPWHLCMLFAVLIPFLCFLFDGVEPSAASVASSINGLGSLFLLASPSRWALMIFTTLHVNGSGSGFRNESVRDSDWGEHFMKRGFDLRHCACPERSLPVLARWRENKGHVCHTGQLLLLGFLFRVVAAACFLLRSSAKASGGLLPLGLQCQTRSKVLRNSLLVFLVFFAMLEIMLLGESY